MKDIVQECLMLIGIYLCRKRAENIYQHMRQWHVYFRKESLYNEVGE